jgi:hypothetical protein
VNSIGFKRGVHGELLNPRAFLGFHDATIAPCALAVLFIHLLATVARLAGPGGARSVVAESVLVKQQPLILNRSRKRSPNLRLVDRLVGGVCALLMRTGRLIRSAIVLKPSTLLSLHRALTKRTYRRLFSPPGVEEAGPQGTDPGSHGRSRRHENSGTRPGAVLGSRNRRPWRSGSPSTRMWCGACSPRGTSRNQTRRGRPGSVLRFQQWQAGLGGRTPRNPARMRAAHARMLVSIAGGGTSWAVSDADRGVTPARRGFRGASVPREMRTDWRPCVRRP